MSTPRHNPIDLHTWNRNFLLRTAGEVKVIAVDQSGVGSESRVGSEVVGRVEAE
jgi:hypothetical protein